MARGSDKVLPADTGRALFGGQLYHDLVKPLHQVGALLDAGYVHPGRSGRNHLRWLAASNNIPLKRADEVMDDIPFKEGNLLTGHRTIVRDGLPTSGSPARKRKCARGVFTAARCGGSGGSFR